MYISPNEYSRVYREIKRTSLSHSTCKLIIFVACLNIDALCGAKILALVLRKELVQYQLVPVVGYTDLKQHFDRLDDDVSNVILVGCGAMLDLEGFLEIDVDAFVVNDTTTHTNDDLDTRFEHQKLRRKIYVIDGNRPWNLDNLFGSNMVVCFDDGHIDRRLTKERSAYMTLQELDDSDSENEDEDDEYDDDEEQDVVKLSDEDEDEADYQSHSEDDEETRSRKRSRRKQISDKRLKRQRKRQLSQSNSVLEDYYSQGTLVITSATATIYALLAAIGETNLENLWLAIVGTSSLDYHYPEIYDKIQPLYRDEVLRLNPPQLDGVQDKTADTSSLSIENDYHLFLLRHWTLYNAFFYSSFVNSKLNLWTEDGKKKLHKLFAKMGISLAIAQQKWLYMDILVKKQLPVIFSKYLPMYGLEGIVRDGFVRTYGYKGQLTAMECVEALTALLELDASLLNSDIFQSLESSRSLLRTSQGYQSRSIQGGGDNESLMDAEGEEERIRLEMERKGKIWVNNFWSSWDAISDINSSLAIGTNSKFHTKRKGYGLLVQGLEVAKNIQKIIFRTGMSVLERKLIKNLKLYRLCVLTEGSVPDLNIFVNPLMLSKLGTWILENITELDFANNTNSLKPMVVASFDAVTDTYLVIGLAPKYPRGMNNSEIAKLLQKERNNNKEADPSIIIRLNTFSVAFTQVANTTGAKVKIDGFDSSVIEIRKDDLSPFLEKLTLSGLI
ncbi:uncharacterized protein KQ657_000502 [Scheffersomyces spartinae]|uniref:CDC45-like protein n=1 Tax=Scheffersomyces spartinae TaxID=45513 RepID=A0A9P7V9R5_9ASCO|nr:uncharacterized protein KQ657_000502 [Scheffersomyces spartinae]KAG7193809.1 hypothetical protein KQ657_000502 [Scheffersomyces spartinae]